MSCSLQVAKVTETSQERSLRIEFAILRMIYRGLGYNGAMSIISPAIFMGVTASMVTLENPPCVIICRARTTLRQDSRQDLTTRMAA